MHLEKIISAKLNIKPWQDYFKIKEKKRNKIRNLSTELNVY